MADDSEPFRVTLKDGATRANDAVRRFGESAGRVADMNLEELAVTTRVFKRAEE